MKILGNEIKPGMIIEHKNDLWSVLKAQHVKPGKGGAFNQVELKSVKRGTKLNERLSNIKRRRNRKDYTKKVQKFIVNEFYDELSKFTQTEGQILIKLIHRQTGSTTYSLIKELRNGWSAFWYNNTARIFNMSLKKEFNPLEIKEDYLIEDIIQRAIRDKKIKHQKPYYIYDLFELNNKWQ